MDRFRFTGFKDKERAFQNFYQHLAPQGHILLLNAAPYKGRPFNNVLLEVMARPHWQSIFSDFAESLFVVDMDTWSKLATDVGLKVNRIETIHYRKEYPSKEALTNWVKQWLPQGKHVPADQQDAFFNERRRICTWIR